jgi:hypothetical protein
LRHFNTVTFNYAVIQLNRLNWRDFEGRANPVACALMTKMQMKKGERADVKLAALTNLTVLDLDPARTRLVSAFVDTYLSLDEQEQAKFERELRKLEPPRQEEVMELTTSWKREGIREGERKVVLKLLTRRFGTLQPEEEKQIAKLDTEKLEQLAQDFLDFKDREELTDWLNRCATKQAK